ncbi:MAG: DUF5830 family protein [Candidatus Hydrothermarchaeaceae archaeon]
MKVERAIGLLAAVKEKEISVKEAVELIELITRVQVKEVLKAAEERGVITRNKKRVLISDDLEFEVPKIKNVKCESNCMRCGRAITSCYFISFFDDEIGPFGGGCIRKLRLG